MILSIITFGIIGICVVFAFVSFMYYKSRFASFRSYIRGEEQISEEIKLYPMLKDYEATMNSQKKTTEFAGNFLNLDSIATSYGIRLKFFSAVPNLLTSLGILGTFLGLSIALASFNSENSEAIRLSINSLLAGMGSAFWTSVAGMACAALFLMSERLLLNRIEAEIDAFCAKLDREHHITTEQVLLSAFVYKDEDEFDVTPGEIFAKIYSNLKSMKTTVDQFGTDLTDSIGNALDKSFEEKLVPIISSLAERLENPAQAITNSLVKELKQVCGTLEERLTQGINDQMNELLSRFITASEAINHLPDAVQEVSSLIKNSSADTVKASLEVSKALDEQILRLADLSDAFATNIQKATASAESLGKVSESLASMPVVISEAATTINNAAAGLKESNTAFNVALETIEQSNETARDSFKKYAENLDGIQVGLKGIFAQVQDGLARYAEATKTGLQEMLDPFTTSLTDATTKVTNAIVPLNDAVSDLNGFGALVKNSLKDLSEALTPLEQSINQLYSVRKSIASDVQKEVDKQ